MSQSQTDKLIDQLYAEDARTRREAARQLGQLGQPESIAELVNIYMKDTDAGVRKAAEDALRRFRQLEQKMSGGSSAATGSDDDESAPPARDLTPLLTRARLGLGLILAITVIINSVILIGRAIPTAAPPTPTLTAPTSRSELIASFTQRLADAHSEAIALRKIYSGIQGIGRGGVKPDQCQQMQASQTNKVDLLPIDNITYPDLKKLSDDINVPTLKLVSIRTNFALLCAAKDQKDFDDYLAQKGSAAQIVSTIDDISNKELNAADTELKNAITNPAATVGLTFTPSPTFTPSLPPTATFTPTLPATITPIPAAATKAATAAATSAPGAGTAPASGTQASIPDTYTFNGLQLDSKATYSYKVTASTDGTLSTGKIFHGSMELDAARQATPLQADYYVSVSEGSASLAFFKGYLGGLYVPGSNGAVGSSEYVVLDGALYENGAVLDAAKVTAGCRATKAPTGSSVLSKVQDLSLDDLKGFALKQKEPGTTFVDSIKSVHYVGERTVPDSPELKQTLDVFVAADNPFPVQINLTTTLDPKVKGKTTLKSFTLTLTYDFSSKPIEVHKQSACETAIPK